MFGSFIDHNRADNFRSAGVVESIVSVTFVDCELFANRNITKTIYVNCILKGFPDMQSVAFCEQSKFLR